MQFDRLKRREFITLAGGAAAAWPLAARAQQGERVHRIGVLMYLTAGDAEGQARLGAFTQALQQLGWSEGRNVRIDTRWATADDIHRHAAELAALAPDVLVAGTGTATVAPLLQATRSVPIVFVTVIDPVGSGFVTSLAQPGGNATGFITLFGGAAAWPLAARAQQPAIPVIGYLDATQPPHAGIEPFRRGLSETGYVEGRNVAIEYRWADGKYDRLPALAADLVRSQVTVIAACVTSAPGLAAKAATSTIPIVFQTGSDPVRDGLVASMNRPGRNVTGVSRLAVTIAPKRLELLRELSPKVTVIGLLVNPTNPRSELVVQQIEEAARSLGLRLHVVKVSTEGELDSVFASLVQLGVGALLVAQEPSYFRWREQIIALAARHAIPTTYGQREYPAAGGLMSYDASVADSFRQVGVYVARILKGEKPADLPVVQPTKFELVLNLKTAKALGLTIPDKLLALADEVIE